MKGAREHTPGAYTALQEKRQAMLGQLQFIRKPQAGCRGMVYPGDAFLKGAKHACCLV